MRMLLRSTLALCIVLVCATARVPAQSAANGTEWPTYGADLANTRYRPLEQIDASNFNKLEIA
jgi:glucose dehydrogenase